MGDIQRQLTALRFAYWRAALTTGQIIALLPVIAGIHFPSRL
jgi:hypothetical protein